ncbi:MAG: 50S ribosomal protein L29 [bacterium]|nr:50S ribosomal protein L29 [bacterium]
MQDIQNKPSTDLRKELGEKRESLRQFRFNVSGSKIKNVKEALALRKQIARILTLLGARETDEKKVT